MDNGLERLIRERQTMIQNLADMQKEKRLKEDDVMRHLIEEKMFSYFTINWRKLDVRLFGGRRTRRMDG